MPGITGLISGQADAVSFDKMITALNHFSYNIDRYVEGGVHLGRIHLGYLNKAPQPFFSSDRRYCILFFGEIFSYKNTEHNEIKSHASFFLDLFIKDGTHFLNDLNGQFAACIYDFQSCKTYLISDRYGTKPVYYTLVNGTFLFAPEVKALLIKQTDRNINPKAVSDSFHFGFLMGYDTYFEKIHQLPEGSVMVYHDGQVNITRYWEYPDDERIYAYRRITDAEKKKYHEELSAVITKVMKRQLTSNQEGLLVPLSGGLDSRYIIAFASEFSSHPVTAYTMGPDESEDQMYAKEVARLTGTDHHQFVIKPNDTWKDASAFAYYSDGMSLINGPIQGFAPLRHFYRKKEIIVASQTIDAIFGSSLWRKPIKKILGSSSLDDKMKHHLQHLFSKFPEQLLKRVFTEDFYKNLGDGYLITPEKYLLPGRLPVNMYFRMFMNEYSRRGVLGGNVLYHLMYEIRMPTFDNDLFDFGFRLPLTLRHNQNLYRFVFRDLFPRLSEVKREFLNLPIHASNLDIWRKIMEFKITKRLKSTPVGFVIRSVPRWNRPDYVDYPGWFRNELRRDLSGFFEDLVTVKNGIFRKEVPGQLINEHFSGRADHAGIIWQIINLEYFYRNFII